MPLSTKELASRGCEPEAAGVVSRTQYDERVPRVEYELTPQDQALTPIVFDLLAWAGAAEQQPACRERWARQVLAAGVREVVCLPRQPAPTTGED